MRKQYSTSLDENIIKELKLRAVEENRPANGILEEALESYFDNNKKKKATYETGKTGGGKK